MRSLLILIFLLSIIFCPERLLAQSEVRNTPGAAYDLSVDPVLYTVGFAQFDLRNRLDYPEAVNSWLKTLTDDNLRIFDKNKNFSFNFYGARMFRLVREYYPERYERIKKLVGQGRLFVAGSTVSEGDEKVTSAESMIRQVLYGNNYFRTEFKKESQDFMLPDYFGFSASLPSILSYCGLKEFSTRLPRWKNNADIPFNLGNWIGPDGKGILAVLNASDPGNDNASGKDTIKYWESRVLENGKKYGVFADCRYFCTNETPSILSQLAISNNSADRKIHMVLSASDQLSHDISDSQRAKLPEYTGDLGLTDYAAGSLTSQSMLKRWNHKNELLAEAAEPLAVMADWLGGTGYPQATINQAWWLILCNQNRDILNGSATPKTYEYAWNDEVLGMNRLASVLESSAGVIIHSMDTRAIGKAIAIYNPVAISREDVAEVTLQYPEGAPEEVEVTGPDGNEALSQVISKTKNSLTLLILTKVPGFSITCLDVRTAKKAGTVKSTVFAGPNSLENEYYKILVNANGDVSSIIDKKINKELLSAPLRLEFLKEHPEYFPALNMDWSDRKNPAIGFVDGTPKITLLENGPVRSSLKIERNARNSAFAQVISLTAGEAGKRISFRNTIEWQSRGVSLKASFPTSVSNKTATYNLGLGTIERPVNNEKKFEVPSHEWIDLTDKTGSCGISILQDSKYGSDFPDEKTLRLTLLFTPGANICPDEATQDWGTHEISYGLYSHKGDWSNGRPDWQGRCFNQPFVAFQVPSHPGFLGNIFSLIKVSSPQVDVRAMKMAEAGGMIIIRLQELLGKDAENVTISLPGKIISAFETDGQERKTGEASVHEGKLVVSLKKYELRSFACKIESPATKGSEPACFTLPLAFDQDVVSNDKNRRNGKFDDNGYSFPAELFPDALKIDGIDFKLGNAANGQNNALVCHGQKIIIPKTGNYNHLYILASATNDTNGIFRINDAKKMVRIQGYSGFLGQSDRRIWDKLGRIKSVEKGFIRKDEVAWFASHMHKDTVDKPFRYGYIFKYGFDASPASGYIQLPDNDAIRIFAITLADNPYDQAIPLQPLYDDFSGRKNFPLVIEKRIVGEDYSPKATVNTATTLAGNDLPYKVTRKDYADLHSPNGVTVKYFYSGTEKIQGVVPVQGQVISSYNDGMFDLLPADSVKDTWFEQGEGRVLMDLQNSLAIDSIHVFSLLDTRRGPQVFSLWSSDKSVQPPVTGNPKTAGWNYIARSNPPAIEKNGKIVYTIIPNPEAPLNCRYLLWITEESGHGPYYFREVDVFEKQK